ncbi:MAG: HvfC family RiPP maturation protein [Woeseiaceae bacterium]
MAEIPDFQRKQYAFAAHIRDPAANPAPAGIEDRRMGIYRELFFNNLSKLLASTFPVMKRLHDRDAWRALVRRFMALHEAHTPYFLEIPREFVDFLRNTDAAAGDLPFLAELAHYEWAELALSISEDSNAGLDADANGDLLEGVPVPSRLAWLLSYRYPVHRISESFRPETPGEQSTHLIVYRRRDDELGFMELNTMTARLFEMIREDRDSSGRALLETLAGEIRYPDPGALLTHGAAVMRDMRDAEILLGVKRAA